MSEPPHGVLMMAYGAPNTPEDIEPFYTDIRRGRKPSPELLQELVERYEVIGGASPLLDITNRQAAALERALGPGHRVYVGMRHWTPWIREAVAQMQADGIKEATALVMAPHFSSMSIAKYMALLDEATESTGITFTKVESWHTHPVYIKALADRVQQTMQKFSSEELSRLRVLFTAHSLPQRILKANDPYPEQLAETAGLIAEQVKPAAWEVAYQSAGRTPEPWLGPDIVEVLEGASSGDAILVCVIGFVADHLEVLYDVDYEAQATARERGIHLERIPMLNDTPVLAECLADVVRQA